MKSRKPPLPVVVVALLYLAVGVLGIVSHFRSLVKWQQDSVWAVSTEFLAVVIGVFLLRGQNWARWLAVAWIAFHVVVSAFNSLAQAAVHAAFLALITWALFAPEARRYFRQSESKS